MDTTRPYCPKRPTNKARSVIVENPTNVPCWANASPNRQCTKPPFLPMMGQTKPSYVGLTANTFKTRFNNITSFKNPSKKHCTELSKHVWKLKDDRVNFNIKWRILKQAKPYSNASNKCNLSLWEKYFIICNPTMAY